MITEKLFDRTEEHLEHEIQKELYTDADGLVHVHIYSRHPEESEYELWEAIENTSGGVPLELYVPE